MKKHSLRIVASLAIFMEMLDSTILNTAIPSMSNSLHVSPINLKISLISYLLMLAIFIPISGWMADKWGAKKIFITAISIFTTSSFICGLSRSLPELIIMRCFQGLGGAFMVPTARLLMVRSVARNEIVKIMSKIMMLASLGVMLGPLLGGFITEYFSWPWIFFINIPFGIIAIFFISIGLEETQLVKVPKFDIIGFLLFGFGLAFFIFGLSASSENDLRFIYVILSISVALVLLSLYFFHAKQKKHSVIDIHLFESLSFKISVLGNLLTRIGFGGMPFLLPLLFQIGFHYSPTDSGLLLMPMALGVMVSKSFVAVLLKKLGYRNYLIINTIFVGVGVMSFSLLTIKTPWEIIALQTFILGIIFSQQYSGMNSLAYQELTQQQLSNATSLMGTLQQFSQSLGVGIAALLVHMGLFFTHTTLMTSEIFKVVFIILGLTTLASGVIFFRLKKGSL